jgi:PAS domain S-box-containing protein
MDRSLNLLVIEDSQLDYRQLERRLKRDGVPAACRRVASLEELDAAIDAGPWDVVLADYTVPGLDILDVFNVVQVRLPEAPVILVSGTIGEEKAVELLKRGISDFVLKDRLGRLAPAIEHALQDAAQRRARKASDAALTESEDRFRRLFEFGSDAFMTTDALGIITSVNRQMEALTGRSREELIQSPFTTCFIDSQRAEDAIRLALSEERVAGHELTVRSRSGVETVVSCNATTFHDRAGALQGVLAAARDVTDRKRFERTLQEKNVELERASSAKDRFLASISHELRTPLNAIIGFTGMLLMKVPGPLTTDQASHLKTIQTAGRHLMSLINELLDLAKIESGNVELSVEDVSCGSVVSEVASTLGPLAEAKGLPLEVVPFTDDITLQTNRRALSQIVINLANNAIKYTEHGSVRLEIARRRTNDGFVAEIRVIDTGAGIRPEDRARLFRAFDRLEPTPTGHEGTGLGLHLSQKLATLLGGRIVLESEHGIGSTFTVMLPDRSGDDVTVGRSPTSRVDLAGRV